MLESSATCVAVCVYHAYACVSRTGRPLNPLRVTSLSRVHILLYTHTTLVPHTTHVTRLTRVVVACSQIRSVCEKERYLYHTPHARSRAPRARCRLGLLLQGLATCNMAAVSSSSLLVLILTAISLCDQRHSSQPSQSQAISQFSDALSQTPLSSEPLSCAQCRRERHTALHAGRVVVN